MSRRTISAAQQDLMYPSSEVENNCSQSHQYQKSQGYLSQYLPYQHRPKRSNEALPPEDQPSKRQRSQGPTLNTYSFPSYQRQASGAPEVNGSIHGQVQQHYQAFNIPNERSYDKVRQVDPPKVDLNFSSSLFGPPPRPSHPSSSLGPPDHRLYRSNISQAYDSLQPPPNFSRGSQCSAYATGIQDRSDATNHNMTVYNRQINPSAPLTVPNIGFAQQLQNSRNSIANSSVKKEPMSHYAPKPTPRMKILDSFSDDETPSKPSSWRESGKRSYGGFRNFNKRRKSIFSDSSDFGSVDNPIELDDDPVPMPKFERSKTRQVNNAQLTANTSPKAPRARKPAQTAASRALKKELQDAKKLRQQQSLQIQQDHPVQSNEKSQNIEIKAVIEATTADKTDSSSVKADGHVAIALEPTSTPAKVEKVPTAISQADIDQANADFDIAMGLVTEPAASLPMPVAPTVPMPNISTALYKPGFDPFSDQKPRKETKIISVEEAGQIATANEQKRKPSAKRGQTAAEKVAKEKEKAEKEAQRKINAQLKKEQRIKDNIRRKFRASAPEGVVYPEEVVEEHVQQEFEKRKAANEKRKAAAKSITGAGNAVSNDDEKNDDGKDATDDAAAEVQEKLQASQRKLAEQARKQRLSERFTRAANARAGTESSESEVSEEDPDPESDAEGEGRILKSRKRRHATPDEVIDILTGGDADDESDGGIADALESALLDDAQAPAQNEENIFKSADITNYANKAPDQLAETVIPTLEKTFYVYRIFRTYVQGGQKQSDVMIAQFVNKKEANTRAEKELKVSKWGSKPYKQIAWRFNKQSCFSGSCYIDDELNGMQIIVKAELQSIDDGDPELVQTYQNTADLAPDIWLIHESIKVPNLDNENAPKIVTQRTVQACASRVIANTVAGQHMLRLLKPANDATEALLEYEEETAPAIRNCVDERNDSDPDLFECESELPDGREVSVYVEKFNLTGPRN